MRCLDYPSTSLEIRIVFLLLNLLPTPLDMWDVIALFDNSLGWLAGIPLISAKVLHNVIGTVDHDLIKHSLELRDIMSVRPGYDNG
jgi:hypothetical protein